MGRTELVKPLIIFSVFRCDKYSGNDPVTADRNDQDWARINIRIKCFKTYLVDRLFSMYRTWEEKY